MTWLAYSHLGVAKTVQLTTQPAVALAGIAFGVQPVGRLVDGSGVLSRATGVTVTASKASGTGTLSGTLSVQTVEGVFTFTDLKMDTVTSAVTLQFASSGLTSAVSNAFNVTQPNTVIGCEVGAYAVTGTAQTLIRGPYMMRQDTVGSYAVTGTAATLTYSNATVLVSTDWSTGTGSTDALIREDAKPHAWEWIGYGTKRLDVVSAAGLGFPSGMTNVLRALSPAGSQTYTQVQSDWAPIAIGETLYFRVYFRQAFADSAGNLGFPGNHTMESAIGGGSFGSDGGWTITWGSNNNGTFPIRWEFQPYGPTYVIALGTNASGAPQPLTKGVTYRLEWSIRRTAATTAEFHGRVFDDAVSTTVPLYDDNNMSGYDYAGGFHSGTIVGGYGTNLPLPAASFGTFELGPNGSGWSLPSNQYAYYGGCRVIRGTSWIGAYVPGES